MKREETVIVIPREDREAAIARAAAQVEALGRCLARLLGEGLRVVHYKGWQIAGHDRLTVTVAPSPRLHILYAEHCAPVRRRHDGRRGFVGWQANDEPGIHIEWEEAE